MVGWCVAWRRLEHQSLLLGRPIVMRRIRMEQEISMRFMPCRWEIPLVERGMHPPRVLKKIWCR